jgi:hypothetical protein
MRITPLLQVGLFLIVIILACVVVMRSTEEINQVRPALPREGFRNKEPSGPVETDIVDGPAPDTLNQPRTPYHLLEGVLPNAPIDRIGCLTAGCCNETDFEARTNLTGNYLQRTNNYKRGYPDNCSAPLHEFTLRFYKPETLNLQK